MTRRVAPAGQRYALHRVAQVCHTEGVKPATRKEHTMATTALYDFGKADGTRTNALAACVGRQAVYTTWEGDRIVGTIEAPTGASRYPIIRFPDGRWARCDSRIEIVNR